MIRKLITFLASLVLIALTIAMLFLASAIYDSAKKSSVDTYFFQTNRLSEMRPGAPVTPAELGETAMREMLIKKYVTEYFYAIPDIENIARRMTRASTLAWMSTPAVFNDWLDSEAIEIQALTDKKMMRMVEIDGEIYKPADSDFWIVPYVLYTWETPNDMDTNPIVTHGTLLLDVFFAPGITDKFDVGNYLKHDYNRFEPGRDPATIFRFGVRNLEQVTND
ncbi:MAG: hypothetical protein IKP05_02210 [Alphaproteobacteria bacterium]|nr:hypothetical protein [Alphaproteobacteria bacterium]